MFIYRLFLTLIAPVLMLILALRVLRKQESYQDFCERLGLMGALPRGDVIWFHGASNGELKAAKPFIEGAAVHAPNANLFLTCNSKSAKHMLEAWAIEGAQVRLAPFDLRWIYRRMIRHMNVRVFVLIEADFWPNRILAAHQMNVPLALLGGRVSRKSARVWGKFPHLARRMFQAFDLVIAQDQTSETRIRALGADQNAISAQLSLKSLFENEASILNHSERKDIWLAASTHEGEDEVLLKAHLEIQKTAPDTRLILAPRHPKRGDQIARLAKALKFNVSQRSMGGCFEQSSDVFIADTLGEMAQWYRVAGSCFVAGSLVEKGGHTPYEPLAFDCALLHGSYLENFADPYARLNAERGAMLCETPKDIAKAVLSLQNQDVANKQRENARRALARSDQFAASIEKLFQLSKN